MTTELEGQTGGQRDGMEVRKQINVHAGVEMLSFFPFVVLCGGTESRQDGDRQGERTVLASDVGDSTFAVFLHGDFYIGGRDVALLAALLPRPRPAVAFILLDDVQHLQPKRYVVLK